MKRFRAKTPQGCKVLPAEKLKIPRTGDCKGKKPDLWPMDEGADASSWVASVADWAPGT